MSGDFAEWTYGKERSGLTARSGVDSRQGTWSGRDGDLRYVAQCEL
jgi:hypothetical protein